MPNANRYVPNLQFVICVLFQLLEYTISNSFKLNIGIPGTNYWVKKTWPGGTLRAYALKVEDSHLKPRKPSNPMSCQHIRTRYLLWERGTGESFFHTTDQKFTIVGNWTLVMGDALQVAKLLSLHLSQTFSSLSCLHFAYWLSIISSWDFRETLTEATFMPMLMEAGANQKAQKHANFDRGQYIHWTGDLKQLVCILFSSNQIQSFESMCGHG